MEREYAVQLRDHPAKPGAIVYEGQSRFIAQTLELMAKNVDTRFIRDLGALTDQELKLLKSGWVFCDETCKAGVRLNRVSVDGMMDIYQTMTQNMSEVVVLGIESSKSQYLELVKKIGEYNQKTAQRNSQALVALYEGVDFFGIFRAVMGVKLEAAPECIDGDRHGLDKPHDSD